MKDQKQNQNKMDKSNIGILEYETWNNDQIITWIMNLENGRFKNYTDILSSGNCQKEIDKRQIGAEYRVGDIITVCLDCNKWTIAFLKNGNRLCDDLDIDQNAYFPFISFTHPFHKYQAVM